MSKCRFVQPEIVRLELSGGDWIEVKKRLSVGESRRAYASTIREVRTDGRITPDFEQLGKAQVIAYLLDWSLTDQKGKIVAIDTEGKKAAAIDRLDDETFKEISEAIEAHADRESAKREEEKNAQSGESVSAATSPSVV